MKKVISIILTLVLALPAVANAQSIFAGWDFADLDTFGPGASWENNPANHGVMAGSAKIITSAFEQIDSINGSNIDTFQVTTNDGTTIGTTGTSFSTGIDDPQALAIFNQGVNGKAIIVQFSTLGASGFSLQYAIRRGTDAANSNQWAWSTDGQNFTNFGALDVPTTSYSAKSYDLTSITTLNNKANVFLRYTLSGSTASGANPESALAIDNFRINAAVIPEAAHFTFIAALTLLAILRIRRR